MYASNLDQVRATSRALKPGQCFYIELVVQCAAGGRTWSKFVVYMLDTVMHTCVLDSFSLLF